MKHNVAIIIPVFNEAATIKNVVVSLLKIGIVIVVDDGSSDASEAQALKSGAIVVKNKQNLGYDKALKVGITEANRLGYCFSITTDGDGQIPSGAVKQVADSLSLGADLVVGIRTKKQRWAECIFGGVSKILWGIPDPLCGLKGYRLSYFSRIENFDTYGSVGTEFAIKMVKLGVKAINIPVQIDLRQGESRFGSGLRANIKILKALAHAIF